MKTDDLHTRFENPAMERKQDNKAWGSSASYKQDNFLMTIYPITAGLPIPFSAYTLGMMNFAFSLEIGRIIGFWKSSFSS